MLAWLARLNPFKTPDSKRLAVLFAVVYFAQGMWYLPNQTITIVLKDRGLSAGQVADFGLITIIPWFIKPVYGLLSDFVPLFGRRRQSYFLITSALAGVAGLALAWGDWIANGQIKTLTLPLPEIRFVVPWTEIAGKPLEFVLGGPLTLTLAESAAFRETWRAIRAAARGREVWIVAGFIFFFWFSPSFGPAFLYYQTDVLGFSQQFIGRLAALAAVAGVIGAAVYAPLSRRMPLKHIINVSIAFGVAGTLAYLLYRDKTSAMVIDISYGAIGMIVQLAFLDLAAKA